MYVNTGQVKHWNHEDQPVNVTTCDNLSAKNKFVIYYKTIENKSKNIILHAS